MNYLIKYYNGEELVSVMETFDEPYKLDIEAFGKSFKYDDFTIEQVEERGWPPLGIEKVNNPLYKVINATANQYAFIDDDNRGEVVATLKKYTRVMILQCEKPDQKSIVCRTVTDGTFETTGHMYLSDLRLIENK